MGVDVVDDESGLYHVSGHANRPDLEKYIKLFNLNFLYQCEEHRHLREHSKLASKNGFSSFVCIMVIFKYIR